MSRFWEVWDEEHVNSIVTAGWGKGAPHRGLFVQRVLEEMEGDSVLDVGCGVGRYAAFFQETEYQYHGVDSSEMMLAVAKQRYPDMSFSRGDVYDLADAPEADTVIAIALLIHLPDVEAAIRELWSRARKCLILTVTIREGGRYRECSTYTRDKRTHGFPDGKRIISRAEDPAKFRELLCSLNPSDVASWAIDGPVELFKVVR